MKKSCRIVFPLLLLLIALCCTACGDTSKGSGSGSNGSNGSNGQSGSNTTQQSAPPVVKMAAGMAAATITAALY